MVDTNKFNIMKDPVKKFTDGVSDFDIVNNNTHMKDKTFGVRKTYLKNGKSYCLRCKEECNWCDCKGYWN